MKKLNLVVGFSVVLLTIPVEHAVAVDYSTLSNEEMIEMRRQAQTLSAEDHAQFRNEMRSRVSAMSEEERSLMREMNMNRQGSGSGKMEKRRDGSGGGKGYGQGQGVESMGRTRSQLYQGSGQGGGYGRGYGRR